MSEWTSTARKLLEDYCSRARAGLTGSGADADEVVDDLKRHVEEEVNALGLKVVTEEDVRKILARVGEPGANAEESAKPRQAYEKLINPWPHERKSPGYFSLVLGVVLPIVTIVFEWMTGWSAGVLFDPIPNWFALCVLIMVPAVNLWTWLAGRAKEARRAQLLGWLSGAAIGISFFYSILYLPFAPIAFVGIIAYGLGFIPLTPFLAFAASLYLRYAYKTRLGRQELAGAIGVVGTVALLTLLQLPAALTYYGLDQASFEDRETRDHGVRTLRAFGDEEIMLRAAYGGMRRELDMDLVRQFASGGREVSTEKAREIYYRVTGRPFNSEPPPTLYTRMGRWSAMDDEFTWDNALGGEAVAGRVKGLSLASSRLDAATEPDAALVYCEWTMEFKNVAPREREARAQIALPPGAVVTRLTLWINGEEREAAFGGRSQVRGAYQEVAVVQRRDPVLVTTCGPDRVLLQCFPVPRDGGTMKVRIGITAPLVLSSLEQGRFLWPRFLERNFQVASSFRHSYWIESALALSSEGGAVGTNAASVRPCNWHESIAEAALVGEGKWVEVNRSANVKEVLARGESDGDAIRQTIQSSTRPPLSRLVLVVDASAGMRGSIPEIADALKAVAAGTEISVVVAEDEPHMLKEKPGPANPALLEELQRGLRRTACAGGRDNLPALEEGWDLAGSAAKGAVVWVHLPQAALLSPESALVQRLERMAGGALLYEIQARNGPDRIVEKLDGLVAVRHVPRFGSLGSDLKALIEQLAGGKARLELVREKINGSGTPAGALNGSKHVARLWARDEAMELFARHKPDAAIQLAAGYQLVTPFSGAVVLETRQQYERHGLNPADPSSTPSIPSVPEPQTWVLLGVGMGILLFVRWTKRMRTATRQI